MPEETNNSSSGNNPRPEESGYTPKPIFGREPKPAEPQKPAGPRSIFERSADRRPEEPKAAKTGPKVILGGATQKRAVPAKDGSPRPLLKNAVVRRRVEATIEEIALRNPGLKASVLEAAQGLIRTANLERKDDESIILWGSELQRKHASLLEKALGLVQAEIIENAKRLIGEIVESLESLSPEHLLGEPSGLGKLVGAFFGTKSPKEIFDARYGLLESRMKDLEGRLPGLKTLKGEIEGIETESEKIEDGAAAAIAAAAYLASHLRALYESGSKSDGELEIRADAFDRRAESLLLTRSALAAERTQRKLLVDAVERLIECVQDVLLVEVPAWRTNYLGLFSVAMNRDSDTAARFEEVARKQQDILKKLRT